MSGVLVRIHTYLQTVPQTWSCCAVYWLQSFVKSSLPSQRLEKFVQIKQIVFHAIKG